MGTDTVIPPAAKLRAIKSWEREIIKTTKKGEGKQEQNPERMASKAFS